MSAWGFQCLSNFEGNFVFSVGVGLSYASDEMNENIQGGPKVGIQYIVHYCTSTVYPLLAHSVHPVRLQAQANLQLEIKYKRRIKTEQGNQAVENE